MTAPFSIIACPSLRPEIEMLTGGQCSVRYQDMALHDRPPDALRAALQTAIDAENSAVALTYGLCNRGILGLRARHAPIALPRAYDCLALLLGSAERYRKELEHEPGTYFQSTGWMEAAKAAPQTGLVFGPHSNARFETLAARYGEEAAAYLMKAFEGFTKDYSRLAFIATSAPGCSQCEDEACRRAEDRAWQFRRLQGDTGWLRRLLLGEWEGGDILVVQPGEEVGLDHGEGLIKAVPVKAP